MGNIIPITQQDKVALKVQALVPAPQGTGLIQNYVNPYQTKSKYYVPSIKIDHSLSSNIKLSGNWGWNHQGVPGPPTNTTSEGLPTLLSVFAPTDWNTINYRLNYDQTLSPTLLLHIGAAYVDSRLDMPSATTNYNPTTGLGLTGPFIPYTFPVFSGMLGANNTGGMNYIGPASGLGLGFDGTQNTNEAKTNIVTNLTWVKNNHTFKFGGEMDFEGYPNYNIIGTTGQFVFSANETALPYLNTATVAGSTIGLPYASFLLGLPDNYTVNSTGCLPGWGNTNWDFSLRTVGRLTASCRSSSGCATITPPPGKSNMAVMGFSTPAWPIRKTVDVSEASPMERPVVAAIISSIATNLDLDRGWGSPIN